MQTPYRNVYANADCLSTGAIPLNSTWGFCLNATVYVSATGLASLEGKITEVASSYIKVRLKNPGNYAAVNLSDYTLALGARVSQPAQELTSDALLSNIDPNNKVSLELLNAPLYLLGTVTSAGTSTNNHSTAVPFYDVNQALKEAVITVVPDQAAYVQIGATNTVAATSDLEPLQAGEKRTFCLGPNSGWVAVLGVSSAAVNLKVYRNKLD